MSIIHSFYVIMVKVVDHEWEYTLNSSPVHCKTPYIHIHIHSVTPTEHFEYDLNIFGRKSENPENR